jgi:hypothetical protein
MKERDHLEDTGIDGWEGVDFIHLNQDRDKWWAILDMVISLQVAYNVSNFLTTRGTISFSRYQDRLYSM